MQGTFKIYIFEKFRQYCPATQYFPNYGSFWIADPKTSTKERGEKISCHTFSCSHKFNKIEKYFIFEMLKTKILPSYTVELFTQKFVTKF